MIPYLLFDDEVWENLKKTVDIQKYNFSLLLDLLTRKSIMELNEAFGIPNDLFVKTN